MKRSPRSKRRRAEADWGAAREEAVLRYVGMSADEFVVAFRAGRWPDADGDEYGLMSLLSFFPELD